MSAADAYTFPFHLFAANPLWRHPLGPQRCLGVRCASAAGERQPRAMTPAVPRPTYASWAGQQVAHGKLSDLPLFAKEIKEAAYWAARDVMTR
ncbi:MAG TPA: hypothetical protein VH279_03275 [Solirubrobacteraceae bacterium]|jgi:hypothetical protein|nr:hypothetical protein [Solirubrobacteraceae bacterium]